MPFENVFTVVIVIWFVDIIIWNLIIVNIAHILKLTLVSVFCLLQNLYAAIVTLFFKLKFIHC
jgi:hypothetical protein